MSYYPDYVPKNASHFRDMLDQFRKARKEALEAVFLLWVLSPEVDREDILVARGRIESE